MKQNGFTLMDHHMFENKVPCKKNVDKLNNDFLFLNERGEKKLQKKWLHVKAETLKV
jgi:hypothetical protein